jgi:hypothetical protein
MMARLDKSSPYETIGGAPGVAYSQNGHYFNNGGQEVEMVEVGEGADRRKVGRAKAGVNPLLTADEEDDLRVAKDVPIPLTSLHWTKLKFMVESYGHEWKGRPEAIEFLKGQSVNNNEEVV